MRLIQRLWLTIFRPLTSSYGWPALDMTLPGRRKLHLVGSIHMGTPNMAPLPAGLLRKLHQADALIVEADIRDSASPFTEEPPRAPLQARLDEALWLQTAKRAQEIGLATETVDVLPFWQIALLLQARQAQHLGLRPEFGIDYQLLEYTQRANCPVAELEGAQRQLSLLKTLPDEGFRLLEDTLTHWHTNARLLQTLMSWWLNAPPRRPLAALPVTFSQDLYDTLMTERNRQWHRFLYALPPGYYVVAVGALHLYGEGNLPLLLRRGPPI
ncbi:TraB/GumN family protein [Erwinia sp. HR93]|uniref:TraB/GumN family protein n=1 Tax=Erwinia sp. HR93 TaxID=3094840 RepID=UPI002ADEC17B|nr:TraB/GumN family protein [Erwinia sp. HR93]MEA1065767.1 TraB/GumN family protein [Erwinia sp. HR93]